MATHEQRMACPRQRGHVATNIGRQGVAEVRSVH
jgi:hypothetical protein